MVERVADVNGAITGSGCDRPTKRNVGLRFFTFWPPAVEIAVVSKSDNLVVGVVANRDRIRDAVGNVQAAETVDIETWLGTGTRSVTAPATDRTAIWIAIDRTDRFLDGPTGMFQVAAIWAKFVDRTDGVSVGFVAFIAGWKFMVFRQSVLQHVDITFVVQTNAAAVTGDAGNGDRHLYRPATRVDLDLAIEVHELAVLVIRTDMAVVHSIRGEHAAEQIDIQTAHTAASPGSAIEIAERMLAGGCQRGRFQVDGLPADWKSVANKGGEVVIYPKRGRTIIAFTPMQTK